MESHRPLSLMPVLPAGDQFPQASRATHPWRRRWLGGRRYWACQLGGWGLPALISLCLFPLAQELWVESPAPDLLDGLGEVLARMTLGLIATHILRLGLIRLRFLLLRSRWMMPLVLAWCGVVALGLFAANCWITVGLFHRILVPPNVPRLLFLVAACLMCFGLCCAWTGLYFGINYYLSSQARVRENARLAYAVRDAELQALRAQLNPHFLFNCLNTLRALIPRDLTPPRSAITLLADLLRSSLAIGGQTTIPLYQELETVENYLALEQLRLESRLRVARSISSEAVDLHLPPLALQTLVENAVKYGIAARKEGGVIRLEAHVQAGMLCVRVLNPGSFGHVGTSTGLGLKNTRTRLALLFGASARLTLLQTGPDQVAAEIILPAVSCKPSPVTADLAPLPSP